MLDLDNESKSGASCFSLRCLIYKVHATRRKLSYDIMSFSSCQALFSSFSNFFVLSSAKNLNLYLQALSNLAAALASSLTMLSPVLPFVKHFFQILQIFFKPPDFVLNLCAAFLQPGYLTKSHIICLSVKVNKSFPVFCRSFYFL